MAFHKSPSNSACETNLTSFEKNQNVSNLISLAEHSPSINKRANRYEFDQIYKQQGKDLAAEYAKRKTTTHRDEIVHSFVTNKTFGPASQLAEVLPLFANSSGRLGEYIESSVTKTAKQDDEGNSFIDLIVEIKNTWMASPEAPKEAKDLPQKMSFLVDVTTAWGDQLKKKQDALLDEFLVRGKEASVLCYRDSLGGLGLTRPKLVVSKDPHYVEKVGESLGLYVVQKASDAFSITNPSKFNEKYREFFLDFLKSIKQNAEDSIAYMQSLETDKDRQQLIDKYKKIIQFIEVYEKTPTKRPRGS